MAASYYKIGNFPHRSYSLVKPVLNGQAKEDKRKDFSRLIIALMQVKSIAECSWGAFHNTLDLH